VPTIVDIVDYINTLRNELQSKIKEIEQLENKIQQLNMAKTKES
jgi:hypothetical protein